MEKEPKIEKDPYTEIENIDQLITLARRESPSAEIVIQLKQDGPVQYENAEIRVPESTVPPQNEWKWKTMHRFASPYLMHGDMPKYRQEKPNVWLEKK